MISATTMKIAKRKEAKDIRARRATVDVEALNALHERGEKLGILGDKVAALGDEAESFHDMAKKLRQQYSKNPLGW